VIRAVTPADVRLALRPGCPIGIDALRLVEVAHLGFDGATRAGRIIVHADYAEAIAHLFAELLAARFPIERIEPIDAYGADDERSMAANNTSGFNGREIARMPGVWSEHAYGRAIDLNPVQNPYLVAGTVHPSAGAAYLDRGRDASGMIHADGVVVRAFAAIGWSWGGLWTDPVDYHHFSATGR
jgi:hypothetical protein